MAVINVYVEIKRLNLKKFLVQCEGQFVYVCYIIQVSFMAAARLEDSSVNIQTSTATQTRMSGHKEQFLFGCGCR